MKLATLLMSVVTFGASALSMSSNTVIGNTTSHSSGSVKGVKVIESEGYSESSLVTPLGTATSNSHSESTNKIKYNGSTYGSANTNFTKVSNESASGIEVSYTTYSGDAVNGSNVKYVDKYSSHSHVENTFSDGIGNTYEHTDTDERGKAVTNVKSRTNSADSGWEITWME